MDQIPRRTRYAAAFAVAALPIGLAAALLIGPSSSAAAPERPARVVSPNQQRGDSTRAPRTKASKTRGDEHKSGGPMEVFSDIERGWQNNDVNGILRHFGKSKVTISIEGTGPSGGKFSRSQSYYLLKDLFKYTITKKFEFVQYRKPGDDGRSSFAVAERLYQKSDDGRLFKDKIYVSLQVEDDGRWVVNEIKSIQ